VGTVRIVYI